MSSISKIMRTCIIPHSRDQLISIPRAASVQYLLCWWAPHSNLLTTIYIIIILATKWAVNSKSKKKGFPSTSITVHHPQGSSAPLSSRKCDKSDAQGGSAPARSALTITLSPRVGSQVSPWLSPRYHSHLPAYQTYHLARLVWPHHHYYPQCYLNVLHK